MPARNLDMRSPPWPLPWKQRYGPGFVATVKWNQPIRKWHRSSETAMRQRSRAPTSSAGAARRPGRSGAIPAPGGTCSRGRAGGPDRRAAARAERRAWDERSAGAAAPGFRAVCASAGASAKAARIVAKKAKRRMPLPRIRRLRSPIMAAASTGTMEPRAYAAPMLPNESSRSMNGTRRSGARRCARSRR